MDGSRRNDVSTEPKRTLEQTPAIIGFSARCRPCEIKVKNWGRILCSGCCQEEGSGSFRSFLRVTTPGIQWYIPVSKAKYNDLKKLCDSTSVSRWVLCCLPLRLPLINMTNQYVCQFYDSNLPEHPKLHDIFIIKSCIKSLLRQYNTQTCYNLFTDL